MTVELLWKTSVSATCMHVLACRRAGIAAADPQLAAVLDEPASAVVREIQSAGWPVDAVVAQFAAFASAYENNRELVTRTAARLHLPATSGGPGVVRVAGAIGDLEAALLRAQPQILDELSERGGLIRDAWEAHAPELLNEVGRLAEDAVVPEFAEVTLVAPYAGGHGVAHVAENRVTFEAVSEDPQPDLPEVVRLAWLLCQLSADLAWFADVLPPGRSAFAASLAAVPPVLAAAEAVVLAPCDEAAIAAALLAWRLPPSAPAEAASRLWNWWNAWLDKPATWPVAVAALDRLMTEAEVA